MALTEAPPRRKNIHVDKLTSGSSESGQMNNKSEKSVPPRELKVFTLPHVISLRVDTDAPDPRKHSDQSCPDASCPRESCKNPVDPE